MRSRIRSPLTYANVMSTIAVFVALGGSSYAALTITGRNVENESLTGRDIRNLTGKDIRDETLGSRDVRNLLAADFKPGQLPRGEKGEKGETGATGAQGATGPPGLLSDTLPSGKSLRGTYRMEGDGDGTLGACCAADAISFVLSLASAPTGHFIEAGSPDPACPGSAASPQANPGHLCVYEDAQSGNVLNDGLVSTTRYGADLFVDSSVLGDYLSKGTWAVTAP